MLPSKVHKEIDIYLRAFLWDGVDLNKKKAKVALEYVYVPKDEWGGFALMRSKD